MTGRRLYEKFCDSLKATERWNKEIAYGSFPPFAWPFLTDQQRETWNDLARRLTPRRRRPA